ncbi:unnamed protein product, partial [Polarella glacialis]
ELLRPAVHMFGEDDAALLEHLAREEERYVQWEAGMEKAVRGLDSEGCGGARLVLLEIGCGLRVPSVRMEMECVLRDLLDGATHETDRVVLIRINPDFPQNPLFPAASTISIRAGALEALSEIDALLKGLREENT